MKGTNADKKFPKTRIETKYLMNKNLKTNIHNGRTAFITNEEVSTTNFTLSTKECFTKGWVSSPAASTQKTVDEIISAIQTSISECLRIFKAYSNDVDRTPMTNYVVWRFGDSRRITAAKFTKYTNLDEQPFRAKQTRKSVPEGTEYVSGMQLPVALPEADSTIVLTTKLQTSITPLLYKTLAPTFAPKLEKFKWSLPGSDSKHTKLIQGSWATDLPCLRVCTSRGQLAILLCRNLKTDAVENGLIYNENGVMLASCSQNKYVTCYKPNGSLWFHATPETGMYFDYSKNELKSWKGPPQWNEKNVLELQLNKMIALRFKGITHFTIIYRSLTDNIYLDVKQSEEISIEHEAAETPKTSKKHKRIPLNLQKMGKTAFLEMFTLKSKFNELKSIQKNISATFQKIDTLFSVFFHVQISTEPTTRVQSPTSLKLDIPTKNREKVICPVILRQQIIYQKNRLAEAAARGIEVKASVTTKTWLQCNCAISIPILSDVECQEYIEHRSSPKQMLIICIINSKNEVTEVEEMLSEIYHAQNRKHKKPCIRMPLDSHRILKYDLVTATDGTKRTIPWLVEKYQVVEGMVMMFLKGKLLFCNFYFNGYGLDQHNLYKQIRQSFECARKNKHLPPDFKFGSSFEEESDYQELSVETEQDLTPPTECCNERKLIYRS